MGNWIEYIVIGNLFVVDNKKNSIHNVVCVALEGAKIEIKK